MTSPEHKVLVVDDHPIVIDGLVSLVDSVEGFSVSGVASNTSEVIARIESDRPDLVLLDLFLRGGGGIELITQLVRGFPGLKILVISAYDETDYAARAVAAGALGFVMKDQERSEIVAALKSVARSRVHVSPEINSRLIQFRATSRQSPDEDETASLSNRELHVLHLVGQGADTKTIARKLCLSPKTVESYYDRIKDKLGLGTMRDLVRYAVLRSR